MGLGERLLRRCRNEGRDGRGGRVRVRVRAVRLTSAWKGTVRVCRSCGCARYWRAARAEPAPQAQPTGLSTILRLSGTVRHRATFPAMGAGAAHLGPTRTCPTRPATPPHSRAAPPATGGRAAGSAARRPPRETATPGGRWARVGCEVRWAGGNQQGTGAGNSAHILDTLDALNTPVPLPRSVWARGTDRGSRGSLTQGRLLNGLGCLLHAPAGGPCARPTAPLIMPGLVHLPSKQQLQVRP